jgi:hypothetical protein
VTTKTFNFKPIYAGYEWKATFNLVADPVLFPLGGTLKAHVRYSPDDSILTTLTTENGKIVRVDDNRIQVVIDEGGVEEVE